MAGCVSLPSQQYGNPAILDQVLIDQIEVGTTSKNDVRRMFGEPNVISHDRKDGEAQEVWHYSYAEIEASSFRAFTPQTPDSQSYGLTIAFTDRGVVKSVTTHETGRLPTSPDEPFHMESDTRTR